MKSILWLLILTGVSACGRPASLPSYPPAALLAGQPMEAVLRDLQEQGDRVAFLLDSTHPELQGIVEAYRRRNLSGRAYSQADPVSAYAHQHVVAMGHPGQVPLIREALALTPFEVLPDGIRVDTQWVAGEDLHLFFALKSPLDTSRWLLVHTGNDPDLYFLGARGTFDQDFAVARRSDGMLYRTDHALVGDLAAVGDRLAVGASEGFRLRPMALEGLRGKGVAFHYNLIDAGQAQACLRVLEGLREAIGAFGLPLPDTVRVYSYADPQPLGLRISTYTDAHSTIWSRHQLTPEGLFDPARRQILIYAHEMARMALQPINLNPVKRSILRPANDDWCHYFQHCVLIPALWQQLGPEGWPQPYDFGRAEGIPAFENIYRGCTHTYAPLLWQLHQERGPQFIADIVQQQVRHHGQGFVPIASLMYALAERHGDSAFRERVLNAYPSSMEHSFFRRTQTWGLTPTLGDMFWEDRFVVQAVAPGSLGADAGLLPGDRLLRIAGHDLRSAKDLAHRAVLEQIHRKQPIELVTARGRQSLTRLLPILPLSKP